MYAPVHLTERKPRECASVAKVRFPEVLPYNQVLQTGKKGVEGLCLKQLLTSCFLSVLHRIAYGRKITRT